MTIFNVMGNALRILATAAVLFGIASTSVAALDFPTRRITIVVGFAAGGAVDVAARVLGESLGRHFGQSVVIENRLGADSNIAARAVVDAAPDGYTLFFSSNSLVINQSLYPKIGYSIKQLTPVTTLAVGDGAGLAVNAETPMHTLAEFMAANKSKSFTVGTGGAFARIVAEYFYRIMTKMDAVYVPYNGSALALTGLVGKHIDSMSAPMPEFINYLRQGTVRVLAIAGAKRSPSLPDIPTLSELGYGGMEVTSMLALMAPAATPPEICDVLNAAVAQALSEPAVAERFQQIGFYVHPGTRAETAELLASQLELWSRMVKATGIEVH